MNAPQIAFGLGFTNRPITISKPIVHAVDVSNGMPIISHKRTLQEKIRVNCKRIKSLRKNKMVRR